MPRLPSIGVLFAMTLVALLASHDHLRSQGTLSIGAYELVSIQPLGKKVQALTYRATLANGGPTLRGATAVASTRNRKFVFLDDSLTFGAVAAGGSLLSSDTFTLQAPVNGQIKLTDIQWGITPDANRQPVANAGANQTALLGATVTLNGTASTDPDGDLLSYAWSFVSVPAGSSASLSSATAPGPTFTLDVRGTYTIQLVVNDGVIDSPPDVVEISTENSKPLANAGADQTVAVTHTVTLDGSGSSDVDGDVLTFAWSLMSRPDGSAAVLTNPTAVRPTFVVDVPGRFVIQLIVGDGIEDSVPDSVVISTENTAPIANAGPDQTVRVTESVTLDASASSDVDGNPLTYTWALVSAPAGSLASLSSASAVKPTFIADKPGTYSAQLTVNDGTTTSAPDTVTITTENSPPVAHAGADQTVVAGQLVVLDGAQSLDVDGDRLAYQWSIIAKPAGSSAALPDPASSGPSFIVDGPGTYVVQLIVHDGAVSSEPDSVTVTTTNSIPVAVAGSNQLTAIVGQAVALDGSASSDADGHALTFSWSFVSRPGGSGVTLDDPSIAMPSFTPDIAGDYVAQLIVHDGFVASAPETVLIRAASVQGTGLSLTGGTVSTGDVIVGVVTLADPAPAGGLGVVLTSSDPGVAGVSASVAVVAGSRQAFFAIDGLSAGVSTISAAAPGIGSATAPVIVAERGFDFGPELDAVNAEATVRATIELLAPAPEGGARVQLASDLPTTLAVQSSPVLIPAGEQVGVFTVTGVAPGTARITAVGESGVSGRAARYVAVVQAATDASATSLNLVAAAQESGAIDEEQALLYRVYAAYDSPNLPAAYRGRTDPQIDTRLRVEINERWTSLSATTQAAIVPFIMPPIYEGSWGDPAAVTSNARLSSAVSLASLNDPVVDPNPCGTATPNTPLPLRGWAKLVTGHFNIWYRTEAVVWNDVGPAQAAQGAANLAAIADDVYAKLTGLMGRAPLSDAGLPCNGGDGLLDVYIERNPGSAVAQVVPYPGGCDQSPAYMWMAGQLALNPRDARAIFAHEFMHMIQLAYTKGTSCHAYDWMDEATATWAIEFVYPGSDFEHRFFKAALTEPGQPDGSFRKDLTEIGIPIDKGVNRPLLTRVCTGSGYCDYPFFLYLANRFGPSTIRRTYEGSEVYDPIASIEFGANQASLRGVWHDYSLALYNDFTDHIAESFNDWDDIVHGIRWTALNLDWDELADVEVKLDGEPARSFVGQAAAALGNRDSRNPGHSPVYRLSTRVVSFRITDPEANYITFRNPLARVASLPDLKVWAIQRIDGKWRQPEDWTKKQSAVFCRDVDDEKLDELVLIYSNGDSASREQQSGWYIELDPNNTRNEQSLLPQLRASNAGCYRWTGTTSVTQTNQFGGVYESTATVTFERVRFEDSPEGIPGVEWFKPVSGTATVQQHGLDGFGACTSTIDLTSGAISASDSLVDVRLDSPGHPFDRTATGMGITTIPSAHQVLQCGDDVISDGNFPTNAFWLGFPAFDGSDSFEGPVLGPDGRTMSGSNRRVLSDGTVTEVYRWNLTAERKQ